MTDLAMNYVVNPFALKAKAFYTNLTNTLEAIGRARAAAELSRMGYYKEAKRLMLSK